jgi:hypothetical protein
VEEPPAPPEEDDGLWPHVEPPSHVQKLVPVHHEHGGDPETPAFEDRVPGATPSAHTGAPLTMRIRIDLAPAAKLKVMLEREWQGAGLQLADEDLVLRAIARAAQEDDRLRLLGNTAGLRYPVADGATVIAIENADRGSLHDAVTARMTGNSNGTGETACAWLLTTVARFGIDEATPELTHNRPVAFAMGVPSPSWTMADGAPVPTTTVTLCVAHEPAAVTAWAAARLLARVRELMGDPYALLGD